MIILKGQTEWGELHLLHPTLLRVLQYADSIWGRYTGEQVMVITCIYRDRDETVRIYNQAGKKPPRVSVHELLPCRGLDLGVRRVRPTLDYGSWPLMADEMGFRLASDINQKWCYQESEDHQVALYHNVSGPHIHTQVRDETAERY